MLPSLAGCVHKSCSRAASPYRSKALVVGSYGRNLARVSFPTHDRRQELAGTRPIIAAAGAATQPRNKTARRPTGGWVGRRLRNAASSGED